MNHSVTVQFSQLEDAYMWVSGSPGECSAAINLETGNILMMSPVYPCDEIPDDIDDEGKYLPIPDQYELDLGNALAFEFAANTPALDYDEVRNIFRKRGTYSRFGDLLERAGPRDAWFKYRHDRVKDTLLAWCGENGIGVSE